jgi:hypothetical protein
MKSKIKLFILEQLMLWPLWFIALFIIANTIKDFYRR